MCCGAAPCAHCSAPATATAGSAPFSNESDVSGTPSTPSEWSRAAGEESRRPGQLESAAAGWW
jgi:hypothetical protein